MNDFFGHVLVVFLLVIGAIGLLLIGLIAACISCAPFAIIGFAAYKIAELYK